MLVRKERKMKLRVVDYGAVRGKYVLLRVDFNVQIENGKILDTFRIEQTMPTINALRAAGARVALCAHLGRPKGHVVPELSLRPVAVPSRPHRSPTTASESAAGAGASR